MGSYYTHIKFALHIIYNTLQMLTKLRVEHCKFTLALELSTTCKFSKLMTTEVKYGLVRIVALWLK